MAKRKANVSPLQKYGKCVPRSHRTGYNLAHLYTSHVEKRDGTIILVNTKICSWCGRKIPKGVK